MHPDTIASLSGLVRTRTASPVDVVQHCLDRIAEQNRELNAFISVTADAALEEARALEAELVSGHWRGPLHGVPVAVKDFFDTAHVRTTAGAQDLEDRVPGQDAKVVQQLRVAGAVIVGKTNMDALGMATTGLTSWFGPVRNPAGRAYVTGGSSAGSAAAVAAGLCYATVDTDAVGSVRLPAACCGVVGFKGSYGLVSTAGILGDEPVDDFIRWMGHAGVTTRSVEDAALVLDALTAGGHASSLGDPHRELLVGVGQNLSLDPDVRAAFDRAVNAFESAGYTAQPTPVPFGDASLGTMARVVDDRASIADQAFSAVDAILLPTIGSVVPTVEAALDDPEQAVPAELTAFANYYGLPALSLPCGSDRNGMPIGLQIVGKPGDDRSVLRLAHSYQQFARPV
jgi:aspartyl-tRNA(Asn)/glutamyl-tRNA(Gln) amidotransferase subunit A